MRTRTLSAFCIALFILLLPFRAEAAVTDTIRVGYYEDGDYMYKNAQGQYEGYNFEFLQEISKLSGLRYEVVDTGSWQNAMKLLIDGEIDLLPAVYHTQERADKMLFPEQPMCNIYTTFNVRMEDTQYGYEDFDAFQGMRVGIIGESEDGENFKDYCVEHGMKVDIINYDETEVLLGALENGEVDGVAITHLGRNSSFRSVAQFAPSPLYMAVSPKRPDLLSQINRANNDILLRNPSYQMNLYDKYLAPSAEQRPVFTKEELQYAKSSGPIRVGYDPNLAPLTYRGDDGEFTGVLADVFKIIAEDSGLTFQFEENPPATSLKKLGEGELDAVCVVDSDYLWDERNSMYTTLYYLRTPSMLITKDENKAINTLALTEGYQLSDWISKNEPEREILYFSSVQECFDAVLEGKAQATYANTYVASLLLTKEKYLSLHANTLTQYTNDLCIGVSKFANPQLFSILDKYIQSMASEQMDELLLKHSTSVQSVSIMEFVRQHTWLVMAVLAAIILLLCIYLRNVSRSRRRIQELLYRDGLTGLDNLDHFYLTSAELLRSAAEKKYAFIYCDIDQFKLINDNFGFEEGDRVLRAFGRILESILGKGECCARISADNFILMMEYEELENLLARLEKIRKDLNSWRIEDKVLPYEVCLSIGIYSVVVAELDNIHRMIDLANYARRSAKVNMESSTILYDEEMRKKALLESELEGRIGFAIENREFEAYYQPKVDMCTGSLIGSEALVRWNHPEYGLLMPGTFVPFFEQKGIIVQVDLYIYDTVCRTIRQWLDQGLHVDPVSSNFSSLHFERIGFVEELVMIADRWRVPHSLLEIEITESTITNDSDSVDTTLTVLKTLGFLISIDDFGSGYSSLGQLQQLRADVLKLDRSFVKSGLLGKREQIVMENLINMGNQLEMKVICEGVETLSQAEALQKLGCHFAQGYYYYKPMPASQFEALLKV